MFDTLADLRCVDCSSAVTIAFGLLFKRKGTYSLVLLGRCAWCYKQGDKRSLRATVSLPMEDVVRASKNGLPVLDVQ